MQSVQAYVPQDGGGDIPQDQRSPVAKEDDAERRHCLRPLGSSSYDFVITHQLTCLVIDLYSVFHPVVRDVLLWLSAKVARTCLGSS